MRELCRIAMVAGLLVVAVLAIGINRIVVTDGRIDTVAMHASPDNEQVVAFKSDYFPLER
jgi:hypothetical protein